ncbi:hypothetical protein M9Y10_000367 [Tritrichomonas musculus]|uniref:Uncharacterized protein n=1 Tax=Tritrichomonas musculus TaxID=1915356 RepID=A0ABR2L437_9EUKA
MHSSLYLECSDDRNIEEVLCNRNPQTSKICQSRNHWSNIPSGSEYQNDFEKNYPGMKSGRCTSEYERSFPYERLRPLPQKPQSDLLLYSNTKIYSNSNSQSRTNTATYGNSNLFYSKYPNNASRCIHNEDRIKKALKHIDSASKILGNY